MNGEGPGRSRLTYVLAGLLGAAVAVWAIGSCRDDASRIRGKLEELVDNLEKAEGEGNLEMVNRSRLLGDFFTATFDIEIVPYGQHLGDRNQLMRTSAGYRSRFETISISTREDDLRLDGATGTAQMEVVFVVSTTEKSGSSRQGFRVQIDWSEVGGEWLIRRFQVLEILDRLPWF